MTMTLAELTEHTAQLRACLEAHRKSLPNIHPAAAEHKRQVIAALDPRVHELEEQCARLAGHTAHGDNSDALVSDLAVKV